MRRPPPTLLLVGVLLLAVAPVGQAVAVDSAASAAASHGPTAPVATQTAAAPTAADRCLVVENATSGESLLAVAAPNGTPVALAYTHSVEKTRVVDGYEVRGDRLEMVRMEFSSYGAGLPARAEVNRTDDGAFVFDPSGSYAELFVQPGWVAGHVLRVGNLTVDLVALSNANGVRLHLVSPGSSADESAASCPIHDEEATA